MDNKVYRKNIIVKINDRKKYSEIFRANDQEYFMHSHEKDLSEKDLNELMSKSMESLGKLMDADKELIDKLVSNYYITRAVGYKKSNGETYDDIKKYIDNMDSLYYYSISEKNPFSLDSVYEDAKSVYEDIDFGDKQYAEEQFNKLTELYNTDKKNKNLNKNLNVLKEQYECERIIKDIKTDLEDLYINPEPPEEYSGGWVDENDISTYLGYKQYEMNCLDLLEHYSNKMKSEDLHYFKEDDNDYSNENENEFSDDYEEYE